MLPQAPNPCTDRIKGKWFSTGRPRSGPGGKHCRQPELGGEVVVTSAQHN